MRVFATISADELKLAQLLSKFSETYSLAYVLKRQNGDFLMQLDINADDYGELVRRLNHLSECSFKVMEIHGGGLLDRLNVRPAKTNVDALLGKTTLAKTNVDPVNGGIVQIMGELWHCRPANEEVINEGTKVRIVGIEGVSLLVEKVK